MAYTGKQYLDLAGLQSYDALIKGYIDTEDARAIKFAKISTDGNSLLLYKSKTADASTAEASADFTIPMGSSALRALIDALAAATGATYNSSTGVYDLTGITTTATSTLIAAINEIKTQANANETHIGTMGSLSTTEKTNLVGAINEVLAAITTAIQALDANVDVTADAVNGDFYVLTGVDETDGVIAKGDERLLKKLAETANAEDLAVDTITDGKETPATLYAADDAQAILEAIARDLNDLTSESVVTVEKDATAETGYAATYTVKQNGAQVGVKINIPKDFLVKSATLETVATADVPYTGAKVGDKYIDFVINAKDASETAEHIYLPVNDLVDVYTGGTNTQTNYATTVSIDSNRVVTVSIDSIAASKVDYTPVTDGTISGANVQAALESADTAIAGINTAIAAMDATITNTAGTADEYGNTPVPATTGLTEADGIVTGLATTNADPFGAAAGAYEAIGSIDSADISALFA